MATTASGLRWDFSGPSTAVKRAFMRTWGIPPEETEAADWSTRQYRYHRLWDLYQGTAFDDVSAWAEYRRQHGLYRQIRLVWDHVHALVEFYATHVWPGSLAADGRDLPDGVENAIPLAQDTDPALAAAIGQLWTWWNFQESMVMLVRYTAALGETLVELHDDPDTGKVRMKVIWPGYVVGIDLNDEGDVRGYALEYRAWDRVQQRWYVYRREVDRESFRFYRDGEPFDPGEGAVIANPYGFVPACWFRHTRIIGVRGEPAVWSTQGELDEANALFAHLIDKTHVSLESPIVVSGNLAAGSLQKAIDKMRTGLSRVFTEKQADPYAQRESINVLEGPAGTRVETIEIRISEATQALDRIIAGIERKCPEVTFYEQLRAMTQITGPAADRLLGDVSHKLRTIAAGYDRQLIKLLQMGVAIGGWRANRGDWNDTVPLGDADRVPVGGDTAADASVSRLSVAQRKFLPFDLDSYPAGRLDLNIMPRQLIRQTVQEHYQDLLLKKQVLDPLIPTEQLAIEAGYDEKVVARWTREAEQRQEDALRAMQQAAGPGDTTKERSPNPPGAPPGGPGRPPNPPSRREPTPVAANARRTP